jgi:xanthine/CO dehydrogenase XdhC/CoxF family maturation factor
VDGDVLRFIEDCLLREACAVIGTVFRSRDPRIPVGGWIGVSDGGKTVGTLMDDELLAEVNRAKAAGERQATVAALAGDAADALIEPIVPPPHLFVLGAGPDAIPLVSLAGMLGWTTTVWDPFARFETHVRFAAADHRRTGPVAALREALDAAVRPVAIVMSHDFEQDRDALAMVLPSKARYVGAIGPRHRTQRLLRELAVGAIAGDRLHAPAGLSIGADGPAEVALSVVAEIQAVLAHEVVGHLKDRPGSVHQPLTTSAAGLEPLPLAAGL